MSRRIAAAAGLGVLLAVAGSAQAAGDASAWRNVTTGGTLRPGVTDLVPFAPDQRFGPPEFSYAIPGAATRKVPGVATMAFGKGRAVQMPWLPEWQYYRDGLPVHQQLLAGLIARYAPAQKATLTGDGPVELMIQAMPSGGLLMHVVNYAGQRNGRYDVPPKLHG